MTYSTDDESAMELPNWAKWMRALVMALLVVSIGAMIAVGWAAMRLVSNAVSTPEPAQISVELPDGAAPISLTQTENGEQVVIFSQNGEYHARIINADGAVLSEVSFP